MGCKAGGGPGAPLLSDCQPLPWVKGGAVSLHQLQYLQPGPDKQST